MERNSEEGRKKGGMERRSEYGKKKKGMERIDVEDD